MKIIMKENIPRVTGLMKEEIILFFAKIDDRIGYCVIFGLGDKCTSKDSNIELRDAKVAFGQLDQDMDIVKVEHGHKYLDGGGMVETKKGSIGFSFNPDNKPCIYEGHEIKAVYFTS